MPVGRQVSNRTSSARHGCAQRSPARLPANVWMSRLLVRTSGGVSPPINRPWTQGVRSTSVLRLTALQRFAIGAPTPANQVDGADRMDVVPCAGLSGAGGSSTR